MDKKYIIIHYSDTDEGNARAFEKFHKETHKWPMLGYNYVIPRDGSIENLIGERTRGIHAPGYNTNGIGICVVCSKEQPFNIAQQKTLLMLVRNIMERLNISKAAVLGHNETGRDTDCPGPIDMKLFRGLL